MECRDDSVEQAAAMVYRGFGRVVYCLSAPNTRERPLERQDPG